MPVTTRTWVGLSVAVYDAKINGEPYTVTATVRTAEVATADEAWERALEEAALQQQNIEDEGGSLKSIVPSILPTDYLSPYTQSGVVH